MKRSFSKLGRWFSGNHRGSAIQARYFGSTGLCLCGGVFDPESPGKTFTVELIDASSGELMFSAPAGKRSLKSEIPEGHGFALPVPESWLQLEEPVKTFQFRIVETGQLFPKSPREVPVAKLLRELDLKGESMVTLTARLRRATREILARKGRNFLVVCTHDTSRTGAPMIILEIMRHLVSRHGVEIVLLVLGPRGPLHPDFQKLSEVVVENLGPAFKSGCVEAKEFFAALSQASEPRVALVNSLCSTDLAVTCRQAGFSVTSLIHEYPYAFDRDWTRRHFESAGTVVFPCRDVHQRFLREGLLPESTEENPCRISIIPQGCYQLDRAALDDTEARNFETRFRAENHLATTDRLIVACGTLGCRKGFDWFTRLIRHHGTNSPRGATTHFLWIGAVENKDLYLHALHDMRRECVIGRFHHLDELEDVRLAMRLADVFLLCSRIDPFPSVVLEALNAGIPVVCFDRDHGCAELITRTGFGRVVAYQDLKATASAVDHLLGDSVEPRVTREQAPEFVRQNFRFSHYADRIAHLLRDGDAGHDEVANGPVLGNQRWRELQPSPVNGASRSRPEGFGDASPVAGAVRRGLAFLSTAQHPDGEFATLLSTEASLRDGRWDSSPFATSLIAHSLELCLPESRLMLDRALAFLEAQMEPGGVWRYYTAKQFKHARVPPDLDDTACAAFVLKRHGREIPGNEWIFDANRSAEGRYHTWLLSGASSSEALAAYLSAIEQLAATRTPDVPPEQVGNPRFAAPKDQVTPHEADPVVNANVVLYLGENERTKPTIAYLIDCIRSHPEEVASSYYTDVVSFHYMIARACECGAPSLKEITDLIRPYLERRISGASGRDMPMTVALAACALCILAPDSPALDQAVERLLASQHNDGSWPRATFYRGPQEFWGSEELTTGFCLEALRRCAGGHATPSLTGVLRKGHSQNTILRGPESVPLKLSPTA